MSETPSPGYQEVVKQVKNIETRDVAQALVNYNRLPPEVQTLVMECFGNEIAEYEVFDEPLAEIAQLDRDAHFIMENATSLLGNFFLRGLDRGLRDTRRFTYVSPEGVVDKRVSPPVPMANRTLGMAMATEFITYPKGHEKEGQYDGTGFVALEIDASDMGRANRLLDSDNNNAADLLSNELAAAIAEARAELYEETQQDIQAQFKPKEKPLKTFSKKELMEGEVLPVECRYGGDEYVPMLVGNVTPELIERYKVKLKEKITARTCYYLNDAGEAELRNISLKNNTITEIRPPEESNRLKLFMEYFKRGIILNEEEIERTVSYFKKEDGSIDSEALDAFVAEHRKPRVEYPQGIESISQKLTYLQDVHPEFRMPITLALSFDMNASLKGGQLVTSRQEKILAYIENICYDNLLHDNVRTFDDLISHLEGIYGTFRAGAPKEYDPDVQEGIVFNFLKELNDLYGMVIGDQALEKVAEKINIPDNPQEHGDRFRRGGSIVAEHARGRTYEVKPSNERYPDKRITVRFADGTEVQMPFGSYTSKFKEDLTAHETRLGWVRREIKKTISGADDDWYYQLATMIKDNTALHDQMLEFSQIEDPEEIIRRIKEVNQKPSLEGLVLAHFFNPKNAARRGDIMNSIFVQLGVGEGTEFPNMAKVQTALENVLKRYNIGVNRPVVAAAA